MSPRGQTVLPQPPHPLLQPKPTSALVRGQRGGPPACNPSPVTPPGVCSPSQMRSEPPTSFRDSWSLQRVQPEAQGCVRSRGCCGTFPLSARLQTAWIYSLEVLEARVQDPHRWTRIKALAETRWPRGSRGKPLLALPLLGAVSTLWLVATPLGCLQSSLFVFTSLCRLVTSLEHPRPTEVIRAHLTPGSFI